MAQSNSTVIGPDELDKLIVSCLTLHNTYPLYGWYKYNWIIVASLNLVMAPFAGILNLLVFSVILKERSLQSISNIILANLCLTDMITGFVCQPMFAAVMLMSRYGLVCCSFFIVAVVIGYSVGTVSYLTLLAIWTDRYFAIFHPFRYIEFASKRLVVKLLVGLWIASILLVCLSLLTKEFLLHSIGTLIVVPTSFGWSFYVQLKTVLVVKRLGHQVTTIENDISDAVVDNSDSRATKVAMTVLIALFVCSVPQCAINIWAYFFKRTDELSAAFSWSTTLLLLNSNCNPIIYCLWMKEIREKVLKLARCLTKDHTTISEGNKANVVNL